MTAWSSFESLEPRALNFPQTSPLIDSIPPMRPEKPNKVRPIDRVAIFALGIINNAPYVIGIASAQAIVKSFGVETYLGIVLGVNTVSGLFARFLNSWLVSLRVSYEILFATNMAMMLFGLLSCAFAKVFWLECVGIFFIGFASNLGETIILCDMTHRRKEVLLKSWGSGTGCAGIAGAGYSLICVGAKISNFWSFIGVSPVVLLAGAAYYGVIVRSPAEAFLQSPDELQVALLSGQPSLNGDGSVSSKSPPPPKDTLSVWDCSYFGENTFLIINCGTVYFLEYVIQTLFADCSLTGEEKGNYPYSYPLLNLSYQIGVFLSRSSLVFFVLHEVWILTLCQCAMFILWVVQASLHFLKYLVVMCLLMGVVGLFGGCAYVNAFHEMMNDSSLTAPQREMVTSYNSFFIALFIFLSTVFTFVAENTFMVPEVAPE
jgi:battenin